MKKILISFVAIVCALFATSAIHAQSELSGEHITTFHTDITVQKDGSINVVEKILYDFSTSPDRHGIYRSIPFITRNKEGKKYKMEIDVQQVTNELGDEYEYSETTEGDYLKLKIGEADKLVTGETIYIITYTVKGALTYFSDHDELYWNATGNEWNVAIGQASSIIHFPSEIPEESIKGICYTGSTGSTASNCTATTSGSNLTVATTSSLPSYEGLTFAASFPKGIAAVVEPSEVVEFFDTIWGKLTLLALTLGALWWYVLFPLWLPIRWYLSGRDPTTSSGPVRAWFDPPKTKSGRALTPAESGTLVDEQANVREISSMIVNLAQRGYLKIVEKEDEEFEFLKQKEASGDVSLLEFERVLLTELFKGKDTVTLKDAKLASTVEKIQTMLYTNVVKEGYFPENPHKIRQKYMIIAGIAAFTFNFFLLISASVFGRLMPRKTVEGVHAAHIARSLKNFLTSQERQLEFQAKNQMMFEKLLPFAVAFGVEKIWAERFKDVTLTQPDWYQGSYVGNFNSTTFTRSLGSSLSSFQSAATPVSSSTGHSSGFSGGSSGGGGGGGGGGSW